jgi:AraC family transcriptional regulator, regulatory protein of adaptative response / methylated-DNA-[protein]-cysteine methyltransferase
MSDRLLPDGETMYRALVEKDPAFDGLFFTGVTTTGVFCRPTCTARKPHRENVVFFPTAREALLAGYRPCRVCRPVEPPAATPEPVRQLLAEVEADPSLRLRDADLRARGIDPTALRRWFKRNHGLTFQGYVRALRIGAAFGRIKHGDTATEAAFDHGWDSLSGFGEAFRKVMGTAPTSAPDQVITLTRIETPLGPMLAGATDEGICLLEFIDRRMIETELTGLTRLLKTALVPGTSPHFDRLSDELRRYFAGELQSFSTPLDTRGTEFQRKVWAGLLSIPYGQTRSYAEQARLIGAPSAVRAVARANGDNRIAVLVPCHRVVGSDGSLTGYGGGLWRKKWLLDLERATLSGTDRGAATPPARR